MKLPLNIVQSCKLRGIGGSFLPPLPVGSVTWTLSAEIWCHPKERCSSNMTARTGSHRCDQLFTSNHCDTGSNTPIWYVGLNWKTLVSQYPLLTVQFGPGKTRGISSKRSAAIPRAMHINCFGCNRLRTELPIAIRLPELLTHDQRGRISWVHKSPRLSTRNLGC